MWRFIYDFIFVEHVYSRPVIEDRRTRVERSICISYEDEAIMGTMEPILHVSSSVMYMRYTV